MKPDAGLVTTQRTGKVLKLLRLIAHLTYCLGLVIALTHNMRWGLGLIALGGILTALAKTLIWWRHG